MSGTAVAVNVQSVRLIVDDISVSAEGIKYALRNGGSASVGAVEANLLTLKGSRSDGDQVTDIAVSSCRIVNCTADVFPQSKSSVRITWDTLGVVVTCKR